MSGLGVFRTTPNGVERIGTLDEQAGKFVYDAQYLASPHAAPISCSLPLREQPYTQEDARPYFEGLLPEGAPREAAAAALHVRPEDYLSILAGYGFECLGDVIVAHREEELLGNYEPFDTTGLAELLRRGQAATINQGSRLSLAGTQGKVGLYHDSAFPLHEGWSRPLGGAPSTHILKSSSREAVLYLEYLCVHTANLLGVEAAHTELLDLGGPVLCSERFDRASKGPEVMRLHQEDLAQAFGTTPSSKYAELPGGTASAVSSFIRRKCARPIANIERFARLSLFNYLIGNCDNHLKNLSVLYSADWSSLELAPAYDLVCTTWFPDLSREMGMLLGDEGDIDSVRPTHLAEFAKQVGLPLRRLRIICSELARSFCAAVAATTRAGAPSLDELAWKAEGLLEDAEPRRRVLEETAVL